MKYIKDLEAVGFERTQTEAQVQMVLDAIEGTLATKAEFVAFQDRVESRFVHFEMKIENRISNIESKFDSKLKETEFRLLSRLGFLMISTTSIAVALLTWLIKI